MQAKRLLHTEWSLGWGGQEIRILEEAKALRELGWSVQLACRPESKIYAAFKQAGFTVHALPFKHSAHVPTVRALKKIIQQQGIHIVHTHSSVDAYLGGMAAKLARVPAVRSRHLASLVSKKITTKLVYRFLAQHIIASGQTIKNQLVQRTGCKPSNISSVPAGANHSIFKPAENPQADQSATRAALNAEGFNIAQGAFLIGIVAVLRSWKGHTVLFDAFKQCIETQAKPHNLHLLVVGDGPCKQQYTQLVKDLGIHANVHFIGHRSNVAQCMRACSVVVLPSLKNEATSQVLPQAMLCGVPIIGSNAGGLPEITQGGAYGLEVPAGDVSALQTAILQIANQPEAAAARAHKARAHALKELTFEVQVQRTLQAYQIVLNA